jgi:hypothetical protein
MLTVWLPFPVYACLLFALRLLHTSNAGSSLDTAYRLLTRLLSDEDLGMARHNVVMHHDYCRAAAPSATLLLCVYCALTPVLTRHSIQPQEIFTLPVPQVPVVATVSEPEQTEWQAHAPPQQHMSDVPAETTQVQCSSESLAARRLLPSKPPLLHVTKVHAHWRSDEPGRHKYIICRATCKAPSPLTQRDLTWPQYCI